MINTLGTVSIGIKAPIIKQGDDLQDIVIQSLADSGVVLEHNDVVGITESALARSQGNYVTKEDIQTSIKQLIPGDFIILYEPIASRNRFSFILKSIIEVYKHVVIVWQNETDEVGNVLTTEHPFTHIKYIDYYESLAQGTDCIVDIRDDIDFLQSYYKYIIDCRCHADRSPYVYSLQDICKDKCEYGLLGSNLAGENRLKLFPVNAQKFCESLQSKLNEIYKTHVEVIVYGDGCFKDPVGGIWEFADPVTCPGTTIKWNKTPQEEKIKYLIDTNKDVNQTLAEKKFSSDYNKAFHQELGTTPRRVNDLLASLMDLTSGSGDKGTPIVLVKNYFKSYID